MSGTEQTGVGVPVLAAAAVTEISGLRYLEPSKLRFFLRGVELCLTEGEEVTHCGVMVLRVFPLTDPHRHYSVRHGNGDEVGLLRDLAGLDEAGRTLVLRELERRYVLPVIRRILAVRERFETLELRVETDRGLAVFTTRNLRENVLNPTPTRYVLTDVEGNRYDIPDLRALSLASQAHLLKFL